VVPYISWRLQAEFETQDKQGDERMKKWAFLFTLALAAAGAWAQQVSDEAVAAAVEAYSAGQADLQKGAVDAAIPKLEKAISLNPDMTIVHFDLGRAYTAKKNSAKAVGHFQTFLKRSGNDPNAAPQAAMANRLVGLTLANERKYAEAVPYLKKAVEAKGTDIDARWSLAWSLITLKDDAAAEEHLVKVMAQDPKRALAFFHAGRIANARKDEENAKKRLQAFVALTPTGPQAGLAYFWLGSIAGKGGDQAAAKTYFEKYLGTNPQPGPQVDGVKKYLESLQGQAAAPPQ
jgi:tetratricopeptide (TPR) repeat protein